MSKFSHTIVTVGNPITRAESLYMCKDCAWKMDSFFTVGNKKSRDMALYEAKAHALGTIEAA